MHACIQVRGEGIGRVYAAGEEFPGLAVSRAFGDADGKKIGVTVDPQFIGWKIRPEVCVCVLDACAGPSLMDERTAVRSLCVCVYVGRVCSYSSLDDRSALRSVCVCVLDACTALYVYIHTCMCICIYIKESFEKNKSNLL
jgi:hypothetical protein